MSCSEIFRYNKFYSTTSNNIIKNFTIYGERHSGTNWLAKIIRQSFHLNLIWKYDYKHFFGCCHWNKLNGANDTLFIGIVRNIYGWIEGMHRIPYHLPKKDILSIKPWCSKSYISERDSFCDSHWYTKEKYTDIFDMRSNKIEFLYLYMPYLVDNYVFIRYEDLIKHTDQIIDTISENYKLPIIKKEYKANSKKLHLNNLPKHYFSKINFDTKWKTENMIGYKKINHYSDNYFL